MLVIVLGNLWVMFAGVVMMCELCIVELHMWGLEFKLLDDCVIVLVILWKLLLFVYLTRVLWVCRRLFHPWILLIVIGCNSL